MNIIINQIYATILDAVPIIPVSVSLVESNRAPMGVTLVHSDRTNTPEDPTDLVELARQVQKVRKLCRSTDG